MRYLVLSDVHGDLAALEAVLADAGRVDQILFLGDALDFGPEPEACVARLRAVADRWVRGNHDEGVGLGEAGDGWSSSLVSAGSRAFLADLPGHATVDGATLRHYFPSDLRPPEPCDFNAFDTPLCFVGHTHVPYLYLRGPDGDRVILDPEPDQPIDVKGVRAIANPGSIGSPFVAPDRASFLIYEPTDHATRLTWRAVPRSAAAVVARLHANGAPAELQASSQLYADGGLSFMLDTAAAHRAWAAATR
jgi:predicted phosphodiesterase